MRTHSMRVVRVGHCIRWEGKSSRCVSKEQCALAKRKCVYEEQCASPMHNVQEEGKRL